MVSGADGSAGIVNTGGLLLRSDAQKDNRLKPLKSICKDGRVTTVMEEI